jgi:hypothetical protein
MPWLQGRVHEADSFLNGEQNCIRCGRLLVTLGEGVKPAVADPPGTLFLEEMNPKPGVPGVNVRDLRIITAEQQAAGPYRFCNDDSPWPPGEDPS